MAYPEKQDIIKQTKQLLQSDMRGVYFLYGGEEYLKHSFLCDAKAKLCPDDTALSFNFSVLEFSQDISTAADVFSAPPQFGESRLAVMYGVNLCKLKKSEEDALYASVEAAKQYDYLTYIIYLYGSELDPSESDTRGKLAKMSRVATVLFFDFLSPDKLKKWIIRHFSAEGFVCSDTDASLLAQRCACDMSVLAGEIAKICAYLRQTGENAPSREVIELVTGQTLTFEAFFVSNRILRRDTEGVLSYLADALTRGAEPVALLSEITSEAEKLCRIKFAMKEGLRSDAISAATGIHEYAVRLRTSALRDITESKLCELLHRCYEADVMMKSSSISPDVILQSLAASL